MLDLLTNWIPTAGPWRPLLLTAYFTVLGILAVYGCHRYYLVHLYFRHRGNLPRPHSRFQALPRITVQLPIFNERYVVQRLIDTACALDYPRDRLEIQVLDDSTDETSLLAAERVAHYRRRGYSIEHLQRRRRTGFKAGALSAGLEQSDSPFVAIFDADFSPPPDCLQRMVHYFTDPQIGMVQMRWSHLNRDYSLLTRLQAILLDGHFILESGGRNRAGCFFNFNGTAGMWRRQTIEDSGGWQADTLTEDLDLSYRAQLKGWRFVFLPEDTAPGELPVEINSFKAQQFRWVKGSVETARKLLPSILSSSWPFKIKMEAFFHLTANISYPLLILLALLLLPALGLRLERDRWLVLLIDLPLFLAATCSVSFFYAVSQKEALPQGWKQQLRYLPLVMSLGIGMSLNNSKAVLEGLWGYRSAFQRTPKFRIESLSDAWRPKLYRASRSFLTPLEVALGAYFLTLVAICLLGGLYASAPFLLLFAAGYLYTGLLSIAHW